MNPIPPWWPGQLTVHDQTVPFALLYDEHDNVDFPSTIRARFAIDSIAACRLWRGSSCT